MAKAEIVLGESGGGGKVHTETINASSAGTYTVTCGFEPKYIFVEKSYSGGISNGFLQMSYNEDVSDSLQLQCYKYSNSFELSANGFPSTSDQTLNSKSSTGFTFKIGSAWTGSYYVVCVG